MQAPYRHALEVMGHAGWSVALRPVAGPLPLHIKSRYNWIPSEVEQLITTVEVIVSRDEKARVLGSNDFAGVSSSAFRWDEWEQQSLDAARGEAGLCVKIRKFWDNHFPFAMSVKSGYAYFAIRRDNFDVVCGEEPDFEDPTIVASSLEVFLNRVAEAAPEFSRWI